MTKIKADQGIQSIGCLVYLSASITLGNGAYSVLGFNTEEYDDGSCFNTTTYRFTAPRAGKYQISACVNFELGSVTAMFCGVHVFKNNADFRRLGGLTTTGDTAVIGSMTLKLAKDDYIDIRAYQNSGVNKTITGGAAGNLGKYTWWSVEQIT